MTTELLPVQRSSVSVQDGVFEQEFQIWHEDITSCVNDIANGVVPTTITVNGVDVSSLTLEGRSTEFTSSGDSGTFTHFENFSYNSIPLNETVVIPVNQQMIVKGGVVVNGTLDIDGALVLI